MTFGAALQKQKQTNPTEELVDEHLNSRLELAFNLKKQSKYLESMEIYLEILKSDTLAGSMIEKHVVMRLNCHRNLGEVFENLNGYEQAKHHYTQVSAHFYIF